MKLEIGKIPAELLEEIVLDPIRRNQKKRNDIVIRPQTGEDCSACDMGEEYCVFSTDPITGTVNHIGASVVHINCNDAASSGAEPVGILITVLLPPGSSDDILREIMQDAYDVASKLQIEILGGHTEVTDAVTRPVVSGTVIAKTAKRNFISSGGAQIGQGIIMTKWAGIEGTAIIANDYEDKLKGKISEDILEKAKNLNSMISVVKEGNIAAQFGATAMHDATEGGIYGAVWEIADCSQKGIELLQDSIPVLEETRLICKTAGVDVYRLVSSGTMIITSFYPEKLVAKLRQEGIPASIIGWVTGGDQKILVANGKRQLLCQPKSDEIYHVKL
ncbi:MAG: AIR synthase family protein [Clostridiales bacterium]|nr:AIR synthase family protein [Clostridiales bacterium]